MHEYDMMITIHGNRKPKRNNSFFIDLPSFLSIVHENVDSSNPSVPHTPNNAGIIIKNEKNQTNSNCRQILDFL